MSSSHLAVAGEDIENFTSSETTGRGAGAGGRRTADIFQNGITRSVPFLELKEIIRTCIAFYTRTVTGVVAGDEEGAKKKMENRREINETFEDTVGKAKTEPEKRKYGNDVKCFGERRRMK